MRWWPSRRRDTPTVPMPAPDAARAQVDATATQPSAPVRREPAAGAAGPDAPGLPPPTTELPAVDSAGPSARVVQRWRQWAPVLFAVPVAADAPLGPGERALLERLDLLADRAPDPSLLPRLPAVLPKLLSLLRRGDRAARELVELVERDPTLVGEVVRLANAGARGASRPVVDLHAAVLLLGERGLAQLVTRVLARPLFDLTQGRIGPHAGPPLRQLAEDAAQLGAWAQRGREDAFAAYLAGTAAPIGLMVAVRLLDREPVPAAFGGAFIDALWPAALRLSAAAARDWGFPAEAVEALAASGAAGAGDGPSAGSLAQGGPLAPALQLALAVALRQALPEAERGEPLAEEQAAAAELAQLQAPAG